MIGFLRGKLRVEVGGFLLVLCVEFVELLLQFLGLVFRLELFEILVAGGKLLFKLLERSLVRGGGFGGDEFLADDLFQLLFLIRCKDNVERCEQCYDLSLSLPSSSLLLLPELFSQVCQTDVQPSIYRKKAAPYGSHPSDLLKGNFSPLYTISNPKLRFGRKNFYFFIRNRKFVCTSSFYYIFYIFQKCLFTYRQKKPVKRLLV